MNTCILKGDKRQKGAEWLEGIAQMGIYAYSFVYLVPYCDPHFENLNFNFFFNKNEFKMRRGETLFLTFIALALCKTKVLSIVTQQNLCSTKHTSD